MSVPLRCLSLFGATFLVAATLATPASPQTRAADASGVGSFAVLAPIDFAMAEAIDPAVLPGCTPVAGFDCKNKIAGRVYLPSRIKKDDGAVYPIIVLLHGNHLSCGRAYDPAKDRADLNSTPPPRIDDCNFYTGSGKCDMGPPGSGKCEMGPNPYSEVPSYQGYDYLGNRLASYGYVVVSVNVNRGIAGINNAPGVDDDGLILARGREVLRHLEILSGWNKNKGTSKPFLDNIDVFGKLDFTQVGLFGHSRGGEGVRAAYNLYSDDTVTDWKMRIGPVDFQGIFELAPTDLRLQLGMAYDAENVKWNSLLPACDGDVETLDGIHPFDRMLKAQTSFERISTYLAWGANHNFYNSQWQTTDGIDFSKDRENIPAPTCYSPTNLLCVDPNANFKDNTAMFGNSIFSNPGGVRAQQDTSLSSVLAFFRSTVAAGGNVKFDANFNPLVAVPGTVTNPMGAQVSYPPRCIEREYSRPPVHEELFEDFSQPTGLNSHSTPGHPVRNSTGGSTVTVQHSFGVTTLDDPTQRVARINWTIQDEKKTPFFQDNWTVPGAGMDISSYATLNIRLARQVNQKANPTTSTDFIIWLISGVDAAYAGPVKLSDALAQGLASLTGPTAEMPNDQMVTFHSYMETVRIRLSAFKNLGRVQKTLRGIQFGFDTTKSGAIYMADITLSPDLGDGIPPTGSLPVARAVPETLSQLQPVFNGKPLVHQGSLIAMKAGVRVYDVHGKPFDGGVELHLASDDQLPAGDAAMVLFIGKNRVLTGNLVDLHHAVFTLTPEQFALINDGDPVRLYKGSSQSFSQVWDFGSFNKSQLQQ